MKAARVLVCTLLMFWLAPISAHAASAPAKKVEAKAVAKQKALARAKAKARVKAKQAAKARTEAKSRPKAPAAQRAAPAKPVAANASAADAFDEAGFDAEVMAARRLVSANPADIEARERLAKSASVLIDAVLGAEARGDNAKAARLVQKLRKDLHDIGWRVQKMAQKGDLKAKQSAGFLLDHGIFLARDTAKACAEFVAAAEQFSPAGWHAGQCLMESAPDKAWAQMKRAAGRGHAAAQEWMGRRCLGEFGATEKDFVCARDFLTQSASQGRPRAQTLLAYLLASGQGGAEDVGRAARLYKTAAERGDADAQNNLGEILETGRAGSKDPGGALLWYERAAQSGLGSAQFNAGRLWAIGVGEKKDPAKARALLVHAEENGIAQARQVLEWLDQGLPGAEKSPMQAPAGTPQGAVKRH